jgi:hypothetical protein
MSQYANLTEKEQVLGKLSTPNLVSDNMEGNHGSAHRFPFVFAMPIQFINQAEAIAYLKAMSAEPSDYEENLTEKATRVWNNWQPVYDSQVQSEEEKKIISSNYYSDSKYNDALTPNRVATLSEDTASLLGLDPLYTRPNQSTTEIGGNDAINCYWQFNWDDDIVPPMLSAHRNQISPHTGGLGRVYSEMINSNQQLLCISVGVPRYARLLRFYSNLFSRQLSDLNTTGDSFSKSLGRLVGSGLAVVGSLVVAPWRFVMGIANWVSNDKITKYIDFHESMVLYYRYVNSILIELAVSMGLMPKFFSDSELGKTNKDGVNPSTNGSITNIAWSTLVPSMTPEEALSSKMMPIFKGGFDIFKILSIRDSRQHARNGDPKVSGPSADAFIKGMESVLSTFQDEEGNNIEYYETMVNKNAMAEENKNNGVDPYMESWPDLWNAFWSRAEATWTGADKFVCFKLEKTTDSSESISNQTTENPVQSSINQYSDSSRQGKNWIGGSAYDQVARQIESAVPLIGGVLTSGMDVVKGIVQGVTSKLPVVSGPIAVLGGDAKVDIPEVWQSTSFSKSYSFNINLRAPYGDPYTIFQSVYIPLIMLIAMALPRAAGSSSYQQPFVVRAYSKGMFAIPFGIIDSMSIRRGASEFGWSKNRLPTVVEVNFTIRDLSPFMIMAMDMGASLLEPWNMITNIFAENTNFQEYIMTLSGMGLTERLLLSNHIKRRFTVMMKQISAKFSVEHVASTMADTSFGRIIGAISPYSSLPN